MTNYKLIIRYDGTGYRGWEHQPGEEKTIQGKLETAVIRMLNPSGVKEKDPDDGVAGKSTPSDCLGSFEGEIPDIISAGRTDGGVSAEGMCANVKLETSLSCIQIRDSLNRNLPDDICVISVEKAGDRFHARYNATGKTYRYTCYAGELKPVFERKYVYELGSMPDIAAMKKAAGLIIGEHDFTSFCGNPRMKKSCVRCVDRIDIDEKDGFISFTYHGNGFLQYMVRIMTGTLIEVGLGKRTPESVSEVLEAKDRAAAGFTAPARGLKLVSVDYD
ncbi:MAG: tRNA pseudouridine(38-40) synthase TruA [Lachnospiraceae bacterium]|nr:tRNA pseudouridine(38-40) synthase TruA [Lachnospiraceae bacterium]